MYICFSNFSHGKGIGALSPTPSIHGPPHPVPRVPLGSDGEWACAVRWGKVPRYRHVRHRHHFLSSRVRGRLAKKSPNSQLQNRTHPPAARFPSR